MSLYPLFILQFICMYLIGKCIDNGRKTPPPAEEMFCEEEYPPDQLQE